VFSEACLLPFGEREINGVPCEYRNHPDGWVVQIPGETKHEVLGVRVFTDANMNPSVRIVNVNDFDTFEMRDIERLNALIEVLQAARQSMLDWQPRQLAMFGDNE
jgi:hypothetical protein